MMLARAVLWSFSFSLDTMQNLLTIYLKYKLTCRVTDSGSARGRTTTVQRDSIEQMQACPKAL